MHILSTDQIKAWDQFTIENEPVESIDLMERASHVFTKWFLGHSRFTEANILIVAGTGNNGGDGLAVARLLSEKAYDVTVCVCNIQPKPSPDFKINLERLKFKEIELFEISEGDGFPDLSRYKIVIDGIFGTGLSRPVTGYWARFIQHINGLDSMRYSIDIPSGMFGDQPNHQEDVCIEADHCLSFEVPKISFFFPGNGRYLKNWEVKSIGLLPGFLKDHGNAYSLIEPQKLARKLIKRDKFSHKGLFGHALIAAGSQGMIGAAVLSAKACLRSGAGLVTALIPEIGSQVIHTALPEAITLQGFGAERLTNCPDTDKYDAAALGPGLGKHADTIGFVEEFLKKFKKPLVIDADGINILAENKKLLELLPENSIMTPHPGEFKRLFGKTENDLEQLKLLADKAKTWKCIIVLKGAYTAIANTDGQLYFNTSGNPGMSTAGSGDVLTGMICALLSQGYDAISAAQLGVYLHGSAGDLVQEEKGMEAMISGDIIEKIGIAFKKLHQYCLE
jgi:hydroxyethylthiazole kinase-like uncharacterized protein yjeF